MAEYIDREALERSLNERLNRLFKLHGRHDHYVQGFDDCVGRVEEFPAADVFPVRHERWEIVVGSDGKEHMVCTGCRKQQDLTGVFSYCPNCGAKMDGADDE